VDREIQQNEVTHIYARVAYLYRADRTLSLYDSRAKLEYGPGAEHTRATLWVSWWLPNSSRRMRLRRGPQKNRLNILQSWCKYIHTCSNCNCINSSSQCAISSTTEGRSNLLVCPRLSSGERGKIHRNTNTVSSNSP